MNFEKLLKENCDVLFTWSEEKNKWLKTNKERNFKGFEDVVLAILKGKLLDILENPNYPNQYILVIDLEDYIYAVPSILEIENDGENCLVIFEFKTLFPSRKLLKKYGRNSI